MAADWIWNLADPLSPGATQISEALAPAISEMAETWPDRPLRGALQQAADRRPQLAETLHGEAAYFEKTLHGCAILCFLRKACSSVPV